jgi:hypothetical protein
MRNRISPVTFLSFVCIGFLFGWFFLNRRNRPPPRYTGPVPPVIPARPKPPQLPPPHWN